MTKGDQVSPGDQRMGRSQWKTYENARREALVVIAIWLAAILYIIPYCYLRGQSPADGELRLVWGMPAWVWWGVVVPWGAANLITVWFCLYFMSDDDLGEDRSDEAEKAD